MAAKYLRRQTWWVRFYHPITRELIRVSLETHDEARAELLRQRVELESEHLAPCFKAAELPSDLIVALGLPQRAAFALAEVTNYDRIIFSHNPLISQPSFSNDISDSNASPRHSDLLGGYGLLFDLFG